MNTAGGILIDIIRPEFVPGPFSRWVMASRLEEDGGAWLDAPDFFPAGSMERRESWQGLVGTATIDQSRARRS